MKKMILKFLGLTERLQKIEKEIEELKGISDEKESLWAFIDEQREMEEALSLHGEEYVDELTDTLVRTLKTVGDA
jgi:acetoin utilization deacetylase AcuC-like enzyme|tara:strand:- start:172 stop:396 length:225 start_codon:yes stop_codon:yes gene_type:complete